MYTGIQLRAADTRRAPFDQVVVVFARRTSCTPCSTPAS